MYHCSQCIFQKSHTMFHSFKKHNAQRTEDEYEHKLVFNLHLQSRCLASWEQSIGSQS